MGSNTSYSSPKVEMRNSHISGRGLFAKESIQKGGLIISFENGKGKFINSTEADILYDAGNDHMLQINDDLFFAATTPGEYETEDHINHSCDPNLGIDGSVKFVATRDIREGEELTFDYAMSESSNYKMKCHCGKRNCRKIITGNDWRLKNLQKKYNGYFSDYLQSKFSIANFPCAI